MYVSFPTSFQIQNSPLLFSIVYSTLLRLLFHSLKHKHLSRQAQFPLRMQGPRGQGSYAFFLYYTLYTLGAQEMLW